MCGICGYIGYSEPGVLFGMTEVMRNRGPDGQGEYHDDELGVHLGHRRLAIVDLEGGVQPMASEDGAIVVVFNGEIYNHLELRAELISLGCSFRTDHSDTEVLIQGYLLWGKDLLLKLNGMFAFAIFDRKTRQLLFARDRFGEKPLYYTIGSSCFVFASDLGALKKHPQTPTRLSLIGLQKYFAYGYVPSPATLFEGVYKLPAGHWLEYDINSRKFKVDKYWQFAIEPEETGRQEDDLADELRNLLRLAVGRRLVSDVPVGLFLSGGVDSSTILALMAEKLDPENINTFTIGFNERSFDESRYAKSLANLFGTNHHEKILDLAQARDLTEFLLSKIDDPFCDASILPTFLLSDFTSKHVTVALSGDGGDELLGGYDPILALTPSSIYRGIVPTFLHRGMKSLVNLLPVSNSNMSLDFKLRCWLNGVSYGSELWNPVWMSPLDPELIGEIFNSPLRAEDLYSEAIEAWNNSKSAATLDRTLEFYTKFYLQESVLQKTDKASMLCSLEARAVFLDNDLVEFCRRLPNRYKLRNGQRKYLLKKAIGDLLPKEVLYRRKKGFGIPLARWLKTIPETPPMRDLPGVRLDRVKELWEAHRLGKADHRLFLWSWLSLQLSPMIQDLGVSKEQ